MDPNQPFMANPQVSNQTPQLVPSSWPGGFGVYKLSSAAVKFNLGTIILALVMSFVGSLMQFIPIIGIILSLALGIFATSSLILATFASIDGRKLAFGESLKQSTTYFWKLLGLMILLGLIMIGTLLLLVIPFFIVVPRLFLSPYLMIRQNLGIIESLNASWNITKGNVGKVWGLIGVGFLFSLLTLILIGIYFSIMYAAAWTILAAYLLRGAQSNFVPIDNSLAQPTAPVNSGPITYNQSPQTAPTFPANPAQPIATPIAQPQNMPTVVPGSNQVVSPQAAEPTTPQPVIQNQQQ